MSDNEHWYQVRFSDAAFDSMLMAATEAYFLGDSARHGEAGEPVEIDGYLWGYYADLGEKHTWIQVERFAPALSSKRTAASVEPNEDAGLVMHAVMLQLSPQLSFLGDCHTHPYGSIGEARAVRGWRFSDTDMESMTETVLNLTRGHPPLWVVVAVAPIERVRASLPEELNDGSGAWRFDVGNMRFWVNAEVVTDLDENNVATFAEHTVINMIPRYYNFLGNVLGNSPHEP